MKRYPPKDELDIEGNESEQELLEMAVHDMAIENREQQKRIEALTEGLKKLEWIGLDGCYEHTKCPGCEQLNPQISHSSYADPFYGHKPDCWLAALLEVLK